MKSLLEVLVGLLSAAVVVYVFTAMGADFVEAKGPQPDGSSIQYRMWQAEVEEACYYLSMQGYRTSVLVFKDSKDDALAFAKYVNWRCLREQSLAF